MIAFMHQLGGRAFRAFIGSAFVLACAAPVAHAQPMSLPELTALVALGLADGERHVVFGFGEGLVSKTGPGDFIWTYKAQPEAAQPLGQDPPQMVYSFEEIEPCLVRATWQARIRKVPKKKSEYLYDFRGLTRISVEETVSDTMTGLADAFDVNAVRVRFEPRSVAPDTIQRTVGEMLTSLSIGEVRAAALQLLSTCPS